MKNDNSRALDKVEYSLKKQESKKISKGIITKNFKKNIKRNKKDKDLMVGSFIPLAVSVGGLAISAVTLGLTSLSQELLNSETINSTVNISREMVNNMGTLSVYNLSLPVLSSFFINLKLKRKNVCYQGRFYNKEELSEIEEYESVISFLDDLKENSDDETLAFPKEFLDNVDLYKNSKEFNSELIIRLYKYRNSLKSGNNSEKAYEDFISFLKKSKSSNQASGEFFDSPYIKELIGSKQKRKLMK